MNKYNYRIFMIDEKEKWIFITHDDWNEPEAFVALVKKLRNNCGGSIFVVGDEQYKIKGDKFDLIYQFDGVFGTVVIYTDDSSKHDIIRYLETTFNQI